MTARRSIASLLCVLVVALLPGALARAQGSSTSKPASSAPASKPAGSSKASPPKPGASASAGAAKPDAKALPPGHPAIGGAASPDGAGDGQLPPGHPAVGDQLPAGHPAVGDELPQGHPAIDDDSDDEPPVAPPPKRGGGVPGMFEPPPDQVDEDPNLPKGTIVAVIQDAENRPIPRASVTLGVLRNSVAKGESRERVVRDADDQGTVRFDGLDVGTGVSYRVSTDRGPATFGAAPFGLTDKSGKHVVVHAYEVATDIENVLVGLQGVVYLALKEDSIAIENLYLIYNVGKVAWVPDNVTIPLPKGFKAFNRQETMDGTRFDEVYGTGAGLRGTFAPGRHELTFRYQIPLEGSERQTIHLELPPRVAEARVMAESSKNMGLDVGGFPNAQRTQSREGKRLLITERQASRADGGIQTLDITLSGLPTPGPGRWVAVGLAAVALALGGGYVLRRREIEPELDDEARADLLEAQQALLDEIVALERAHRAGEVGPKTYTRVRAGLLDALARIVARLEQHQPKAAPRKRRADVLRPKTIA